MPISNTDYSLEAKRLEDTISIIRKKISSLGAELYEDEEKVSKKELQKLAKEKFGEIPGLAQQYLFYWRRENK